MGGFSRHMRAQSVCRQAGTRHTPATCRPPIWNEASKDAPSHFASAFASSSFSHRLSSRLRQCVDVPLNTKPFALGLRASGTAEKHGALPSGWEGGCQEKHDKPVSIRRRGCYDLGNHPLTVRKQDFRIRSEGGLCAIMVVMGGSW